MTDEKRTLLLDELENEGLAAGSVIAGIRYLVDEDLKYIKFVTIKDAAKKFIIHIFDNYDCIHCQGHGVVRVFADGPVYEHVTYIGCICERGKKLSEANGIIRWQGDMVQMNGEFKLIRDDNKKVIKEENIDWSNA